MCLSSSHLINSESAWDQSVSTSPVVRGKKLSKNEVELSPDPVAFIHPNQYF